VTDIERQLEVQTSTPAMLKPSTRTGSRLGPISHRGRPLSHHHGRERRAGSAAVDDVRHVARHAARSCAGAAPGHVYETQRYRHIIGAALLSAASASAISARTPFIVVRIMHTGEMTIFATGCYQDRVVFDSDAARFTDKMVILDSRPSTRCWQFRCNDRHRSG